MNWHSHFEASFFWEGVVFCQIYQFICVFWYIEYGGMKRYVQGNKVTIVVYADISVEDNIAGHVGGAVEDNVGYDDSVDSVVGYGGT